MLCKLNNDDGSVDDRFDDTLAEFLMDGDIADLPVGDAVGFWTFDLLLFWLWLFEWADGVAIAEERRGRSIRFLDGLPWGGGATPIATAVAIITSSAIGGALDTGILGGRERHA